MNPASSTRETGWLPDLVYTGEKLEPGLAFFADGLGRITRFSREPADLAAARKLEGQAAFPGLVNGHSRVLQRLARGRVAAPPATPALVEGDVYDTARMAFVEMLLSGITCVGEFLVLPEDAGLATAQAILRAARDVGIRIALLPAASDARILMRELDALRAHVARELPGDDVWLGAGLPDVAALPVAQWSELGAYAHAQRLRLQVPLPRTATELTACASVLGRPPVPALAERGLLDKRLTVIHPQHLTDDEARQLGAARALACACPLSAHWRGEAGVSTARLRAAGVDLALGTDQQVQISLLAEARQLEPRGAERNVAAARLHAATVAGARSLGAPSGALEVGRPADFFTVNLYDPSMAGAAPEVLLEQVVFSLERRAIREVWVGARPRVTGGRHPQQGPIIARFVELQRRRG